MLRFFAWADDASMRAIDRIVPDCVLRTLGYGVFATAAIFKLIGY